MPAYLLVALYIAGSAYAVVLCLETFGADPAGVQDGGPGWIVFLVFMLLIPMLCGCTGAVADETESGCAVCLGCGMIGYLVFILILRSTQALYEMRYLDHAHLPTVYRDIDPELADADLGSSK